MKSSPKQLANLRPAKKGEVRNPKGYPKGQPHFMTRFREELLSDAPWQGKCIETFKKRMVKADAQFWRMFFDQIGPEAAAQAAKALGVTVNVSQSQAQAVALPAPDISADDRMIELAKLFAAIPALPEPPPHGKPLPGKVQDVSVHPLG